MYICNDLIMWLNTTYIFIPQCGFITQIEVVSCYITRKKTTAAAGILWDFPCILFLKCVKSVFLQHIFRRITDYKTIMRTNPLPCNIITLYYDMVFIVPMNMLVVIAHV